MLSAISFNLDPISFNLDHSKILSSAPPPPPPPLPEHVALLYSDIETTCTWFQAYIPCWTFFWKLSGEMRKMLVTSILLSPNLSLQPEIIMDQFCLNFEVEWSFDVQKIYFKHLPNDKILALSKLKVFADDNFSVAQMVKFFRNIALIHVFQSLTFAEARKMV